MKLPRDLSGRALARRLERSLDYRIVHERGSHIVLETESPAHHRIAIPDHPNLRIGTLNAIIKAIAAHKGLDKDEVIDVLRSF
jgi:predicted RNA binding protein YcfA (HicA-like mRNA interferase family)